MLRDARRAGPLFKPQGIMMRCLYALLFCMLTLPW